MTDALLQEGLRRGNPAARAALLQQHQDAVYSYFRYLPMDPDAAQQATISFFRRLLQQRSPANLQVWVYQELLKETVSPQRFPAQSPLEETFRRLSEDLRKVLFLREIAGLSNQEAARVLGVEVALVRTRISRARAELQMSSSTAGSP